MAVKAHKQSMLLLGASGRLGRMMRAVWADEPPQGLEVTPVFRPGPGVETGLAWKPGEDASVLPRSDVVVALWGVIGGKAPGLTLNTALALEANRVARAVGAKTVLHCSSVAVYAFGPDPLDEVAPLRPASAYGLAKLEMERAIAADGAGLRQVVIRIGNVAGTQSLFDAMAGQGRVTLDRFSDGGGPVRSYIAPCDLGRVIPTLARADGLSGPINVAAPVPTTMAGIVQAAGCELAWRDAPSKAVQRVVMNTAKLQALCPLPRESAAPEHLLASARATGVWS